MVAPKPFLTAVSHYLPDGRLGNEQLASRSPSWDAEMIYRKTGIRERHVAGPGETACDLGYRAACRMIETHGIAPGSIDALIFGTQSPDYFLPPNACLL